jgi:hypothetical protein
VQLTPKAAGLRHAEPAAPCFPPPCQKWCQRTFLRLMTPK